MCQANSIGASSPEVRRDESTKPVYVTAVGMDIALAAEHVARMHGTYRLPTMLKRVDRLAREAPSTLA
jgi:deoxyribonuclease V